MDDHLIYRFSANSLTYLYQALPLMNYELFEEIAFRALAQDLASAWRGSCERKNHLLPTRQSY